MNIDELTYGQIKQLMRDFANTNDDLIDHPYKIGKSYIIRTATHTQTGRLLKVTDQELVFEDAAWIADSGRWFDALQTGDLDEIEPFVDPVIVGRGALIDCTEWNHPLPRNQK